MGNLGAYIMKVQHLLQCKFHGPVKRKPICLVNTKHFLRCRTGQRPVQIAPKKALPAQQGTCPEGTVTPGEHSCLDQSLQVPSFWVWCRLLSIEVQCML